MKIYLIVFFVTLIFFPFVHCIIANPINAIYYGILDIARYIKDKRWKKFRGYGINCYCGYFGKGKTLNAVKYVEKMYKLYNIKVFSNTKLNFPYIPFENYNQMIDADCDCIFLIDEASTVFSHRDWKNFPTELLKEIFQCRHHNKELVLTSPRFQHIDTLLRDVCDKVVDCRKKWRYMDMKYYDAWEMQNCFNPTFLRPILHKCWFIHDRNFYMYDTRHDVTNEMVEAFKRGELRTNEESIAAKMPTSPQSDIKLLNLRKSARKKLRN